MVPHSEFRAYSTRNNVYLQPKLGPLRVRPNPASATAAADDPRNSDSFVLKPAGGGLISARLSAFSSILVYYGGSAFVFARRGCRSFRGRPYYSHPIPFVPVHPRPARICLPSVGARGSSRSHLAHSRRQ
ncbi:hypothetical protein EVAR_45891_1 [Eumeta japonica]|uniref:Uncharacterized protein n=1 Tax=Eumeta variegata TaxID=151549 RepID=A0A4C1XS22_EUMVA|nr:hypothetical protein EVAR_45891_1 [Eumeta japonica]